MGLDFVSAIDVKLWDDSPGSGIAMPIVGRQ